MKIAYCFAGHLRTFRKNESLVQHLIGPNPGDVFVHTYAMRNGGPRWHRDNSGDDTPVTDDDCGFILAKYTPIGMKVDSASSGSSHMKDEHKKMGNRHSVCQSNMLRMEREAITGQKYDIVFNARFDLLLHEQFVFPDIDPYTVYGSYNLNMIEKGFDSETFAFGTSEVMSKMTVPSIPEVFSDDVQALDFCGEALFTKIRESHGFKYQPHKVPLGLLRSYGVLVIRT